MSCRSGGDYSLLAVVVYSRPAMLDLLVVASGPGWILLTLPDFLCQTGQEESRTASRLIVDCQVGERSLLNFKQGKPAKV